MGKVPSPEGPKGRTPEQGERLTELAARIPERDPSLPDPEWLERMSERATDVYSSNMKDGTRQSVAPKLPEGQQETESPQIEEGSPAEGIGYDTIQDALGD